MGQARWVMHAKGAYRMAMSGFSFRNARLWHWEDHSVLCGINELFETSHRVIGCTPFPAFNHCFQLLQVDISWELLLNVC